MLANPIYGGEWDDALGMTAVILALVVECAAVSRFFRTDVRVPGRPALLVLVNGISWPCFYAILPPAWAVHQPEGLVLLLEVPVVLVEASVLWAVGRTRLRPILLSSSTLSFGRVLVAVAIGNLASLLAGYLFLALALKPHGLVMMSALTGAALFGLSGFVQTLASMPPARRRSFRPRRSGAATASSRLSDRSPGS